MSRRLALFGAAVMGALAAAAILFGGCKAVLSYEDRELSDAGTDGPTALDCEAYCEKIMQVCGGQDNKQYSSVEACLPFCSTFPKGTAGDTSGNSLACRVGRLDELVMPEPVDCAAVGPGGDGKCGTNCESYCAAMLEICPTTFESVGDCLTACEPLIECGPYSIGLTTPDDPSIQCRLYHLTAAGIGFLDKDPGSTTDAQDTHCPHASGVKECVVSADPMCP